MMSHPSTGFAFQTTSAMATVSSTSGGSQRGGGHHAAVQHTPGNLPLVAQPGRYDILCGRGKVCVDNEGNQLYRTVIESFRDQYAQALTKYDKSQVIRNGVYQYLKSVPCRFLRYNKKQQAWEELSADIIHDKIGHALRFANREKRKGSTSPRPADSEAILGAVCTGSSAKQGGSPLLQSSLPPCSRMAQAPQAPPKSSTMAVVPHPHPSKEALPGALCYLGGHFSTQSAPAIMSASDIPNGTPFGSSLASWATASSPQIVFSHVASSSQAAIVSSSQTTIATTTAQAPTASTSVQASSNLFQFISSGGVDSRSHRKLGGAATRALNATVSTPSAQPNQSLHAALHAENVGSLVNQTSSANDAVDTLVNEWLSATARDRELLCPSLGALDSSFHVLETHAETHENSAATVFESSGFMPPQDSVGSNGSQQQSKTDFQQHFSQVEDNPGLLRFSHCSTFLGDSEN
ncbi:expressed unknown protein [Seminavis robusta]|uniref:DUF6824 domain-containing protein n=1 Tax=Seminavis robusta TaxID=568900 RepID=A0A9N8EEP3_9STRA|nr:expressed unknown protein [Seminavis robusta]|eukprot:Sro890_g216730.1 n/a (464) ;mRNA; r:21087-22478